MSAEPDPSAQYKIDLSGQMAQWIEELGQMAAEAGMRKAFLSAFVEIERRMRTAPFDFGELIGRGRYVPFLIHAARVYPLMIQFSIREDRRTVVLLQVRLLVS